MRIINNSTFFCQDFFARVVGEKLFEKRTYLWSFPAPGAVSAHKGYRPMDRDLSFIIVNWNTKNLLLDCIASIQETVQGFAYEIIVVDNGSTDGSPEAVRRRFGQQVTLIENPENRGFARANNQALQRVRSTYVVLLNSDTILLDGAISELVQFLEKHPEAALAGPAMVDAQGTEQNSFDNFPSLATELLNKSLLRLVFPEKYAGKAPGYEEPFEVDSLIGACMVVRSTALQQVGLLDEGYFFFLEETDWCLRMRRAGWTIYHVPRSRIIHLQGQSKKMRPARAWVEYYRSLYRFFKKNRSPLSYGILRVFRFLKLLVNLLLTSAGLCLTLGLRKRFREKVCIYGYLLWWHVRGCPEHLGLKDARR